MNLPKYYKCGCAIRDEEYVSGLHINIVFRRCQKHRKEMKSCSWKTWAKVNAPAQYRKYQKEE